VSQGREDSEYNYRMILTPEENTRCGYKEEIMLLCSQLSSTTEFVKVEIDKDKACNGFDSK